MKKRGIGVLVATIVFMVSIALSAQAGAPSQEMEIILDASGSMWAQIGGEAKITIAKRALIEVVEGLKDRKDIAIGVRVYGHQFDKSKKNCQDTKLELAFAAPNSASATALTKRITAKGQTPIAYSLMKAKGDFDLSSKRSRTIILITDGLESCDGDPCKVAKALAAAGVDVKMHVVGFDLGPEQMAKLKCLVEPSGGLLLAAGNAAQLKKALGKIVKKALSENLIIRSFDTKKKPVGVYAEAFKVGTKQRVSNAVGEVAKFMLPAGTYDITVKANPTSEVKELKGVVVTDDAKVEKDVVFEIGHLGGIGKGNGGVPIKAYVRIFSVTGDSEKFINGGHSLEKAKLMAVAPGSYRLKVEDSKTKESRVIDDVIVADGQKVIKEVSFAQARIGVLGKDAAGNPINVLVDVRRKKGDAFEFVTSAHTDSKTRFFDVKPGTYKVAARNSKTDQKIVFDDIVVKEGQEVIKEASFAKAKIGAIGKNASGDPIKVGLEIRRKKGEEYEYVSSSSAYEEPYLFDVVPGTYRLTVINRKTEQKKIFEDIVLVEGQKVVKEASFDQAKLGGIGKDASGNPIKVRLELRVKKGDEYAFVTSNSSYEEPYLFNVVPGTYRLTIRNGKTDQKKVIDDIVITEGQKVVKEASFDQAKLGGIGKDASGNPIKVRLELRVKKGDEYRYITSNKTHEKPHLFDVVPGTYRLTIIDSKAGNKKVFDDVSISEGQKIIKEANF